MELVSYLLHSMVTAFVCMVYFKIATHGCLSPGVQSEPGQHKNCLTWQNILWRKKAKQNENPYMLPQANNSSILGTYSRRNQSSQLAWAVQKDSMTNHMRATKFLRSTSEVTQWVTVVAPWACVTTWVQSPEPKVERENWLCRAVFRLPQVQLAWMSSTIHVHTATTRK